MSSVLTDPAFARRLLESAIAHETRPALSSEAVNDLMQMAEVLVEDSTSIYTAASLNRAASMGWQWKAGLTVDQYDLGGGVGKTLDRKQWHDHCFRMAAAYADGTLSVLGGDNVSGAKRSPRGMMSIGLTSSLGSEIE